MVEKAKEDPYGGFKVGDKVRLAPGIAGQSGRPAAEFPAVGEVVVLDGRFRTEIGVDWGDGFDGHNLFGAIDIGTGWYHEPTGLEKVPEQDPSAESDYIVVRLGADLGYAPALRPRVYKSSAQAKVVAISMAEKHGGAFRVFKLVGEARSVQRVVTETEYENL